MTHVLRLRLRYSITVVFVCIIGVLAPLASLSAALPRHRVPLQTLMPTELRWLNDARDDQALAWARQRSARGRATLQAYPQYSQLYDSALAMSDGHDASTAVQIYRGYVYQLESTAEHPRGRWQRSPLASYVAGGPQWQLLLDLDRLAAEAGQPLRLNQDFRTCLADRCMIWLDTEGGDGSSGEYREFDLSQGRFVQGGFYLPAGRARLVRWQNEDSLLVLDNPSSKGLPLVARRWMRNSPYESAREVFRGDVSDWGILANTYGAERRVVFVRRDSQNTLSHWIVVDGIPRQLMLPPSADLIALIGGEWLAVVRQRDWRIGNRTFPVGSVVAIPDAHIMDRLPPITLVMTPDPGEGLVTLVPNQVGFVGTSFRRDRASVLWQVRQQGGRWVRRPLDTPPGGWIRLEADESGTTDGVLVHIESFLRPPETFELNIANGSLARVSQAPALFVADAFLSELHEAISRDGYHVPYYVVRARNLSFDGEAPTLLRAHGSGSNQMVPTYDASIGRLWLERGGVYVMAIVRGGLEFGLSPEFHVRGIARRHTYDDLFAVAEDLIRRRVTTAARLGLRGHSNGGFLVAHAIAERPDLFNAAVIENPFLDISSYLTASAPARPFDEFADPQNSSEIRYLIQTAPIEGLRRQQHLIPPLITTNTTDQRVSPGAARMYAARLEQLGGHYFFVESFEGGHSYGATPQQVAEHEALVFSYLSMRLMPEQGNR